MIENHHEETDLNQVNRSEEKYRINQDTYLVDEDNILDDIENEDIPKHIREARLNELIMKNREYQLSQERTLTCYRELTEDEFLNLTTKSKKCIVHFFHDNFIRCDIMHKHLRSLAEQYNEVDFAKVNVEKAKFFVNKLKIQVLPAVLCFIDGILKHKIIGFELFNSNDNFQTQALEKHLIKIGMLRKKESDSENEEDKKKYNTKIRSSEKNYDDDSD